MEVFVLGSTVDPEGVSDLTIDNLYTSFRRDYSQEHLLSILKRIARNEYFDFLAILDSFYERHEWKNRVNFAFEHLPPDLVKLSDDNYNKTLLGNISENDAKFLFDRVEVLTDIYEKDMENLPRAFVITYKGRYYGHVYQEHYLTDNDASLIGIRTSIYNMLCENHGFKRINNIACTLLDVFVGYFKEKEDVVYITNPLGPMKRIAKDFGFDNGFSFSTKNHCRKTDVVVIDF
jgi:hypothetical protein